MIKAAMLQKLMGVSYERLTFHRIGSRCRRDFMGIGPLALRPAKAPFRTVPTGQYQKDKLQNPGANKPGAESGGKVRFDRTFVVAYIHNPTDSSLLNDPGGVICRTLKKPGLSCSFRFGGRRRVFPAIRWVQRLPEW